MSYGILNGILGQKKNIGFKLRKYEYTWTIVNNNVSILIVSIHNNVSINCATNVSHECTLITEETVCVCNGGLG